MFSTTTPKISVIMPVYNSEDFVAHAIQSVLSQDFDDFELLLMDDGSTDSSGVICDDFAELDSRVRVLHITNGGMCHARNVALDMAHGEYVTFCDNDDECLPGFLSKNYEMAKQYDADVVRFGRITELYGPNADEPEITTYAPSAQVVLKGKEIYKQFRLLMYGSNGVWTGLYRRSMLNRGNIRFNEELRRGCEDKLFNLDVYDHAKTVCLNPQALYVWRRRFSHSSSMSFDDNYFLGMGLYIHRLHVFIEEHGLMEFDADLCAKEMLSPFRDMVGARARSGSATFSEDIEFCAKVRTIYDGYWDSSYVGPSMPQSIVLDWIMGGRFVPAVLVVRVWRLRLSSKDEMDAKSHSNRTESPKAVDIDSSIVAAGIVSYNPDLAQLQAGLESVAHQVSEVIVYDNASDNQADIVNLIESMPNVKVIRSNSNDGLAKALNAIANAARLRGAGSVVFMDQDTTLTDGIVAELLSHLHNGIAAVFPTVIDRNAPKEFKLRQNSCIEDVTYAITAGTLLALNAHESVGGYDERLFVDLVDIEFCYHLRYSGWRIVRDKNAFIEQEVGNKEYAFSLPRIKQGKLIMLPYYRTNHSMARKKDFGRSSAIILHKYRGTKIYNEFLVCMLKAAWRNAFVEKHGCDVLRTLFAGFREGLSIACISEGNAPLDYACN